MTKERRFIPITFELPFEVSSMNIYLFPGPPLTLLDTGPKTDAARQAIEKALQSIGCRTEDIQRIILTHGHVDHFGLGRELVAKSGADVYVHPCDAFKVLPDHTFFGGMLPLLREAGVPQDRLPELEVWCTFADSLKEPFDRVNSIDEGMEIQFESFSMKVIHTPGHSQGHIVAFDEETGDLFAGDHILFYITPNPAMEASCGAPKKRNQGLVQYLDSLRKIEQLPVKRILPAHGPVIDSPRERIEQIYRHHARRKDKLFGLLTREGNSAYELAQKLFGTVKEADIFLTVSEVLAHLDLLLDEQKARTEEKNGIIRYFAT